MMGVCFLVNFGIMMGVCFLVNFVTSSTDPTCQYFGSQYFWILG